MMAIRVSGNLGATVQYRLTDDNRISITYRATVDKPCPGEYD